MSLAAVTPKETNLRDFIDTAIENNIVDAGQFIGRKIRVDGGNYVLETVISGVLVALEYQTQKQAQNESPVVKNIRLRLEDSVVSVDKKRYRITRTIDHLSYAATGTNFSDMKVVFKDDDLEAIKAASVNLLD